MNTLVAVGPGIITLFLGIAAAYITLRPVATAGGRKLWLALFTVPSILAAIFIVWDKQNSERNDADLNRSLAELQDLNGNLMKQYSELQQQYASLNDQYKEIVSEERLQGASLNSQYQEIIGQQKQQNGLPYKQQLKRDVISQLNAMQVALSKIQKDTIYNPKRVNEPHIQNETCRDWALMYSSRFAERSKQLLQKGQQLGVLSPVEAATSPIYSNCMDIEPERNRLVKLRDALPD